MKKLLISSIHLNQGLILFTLLISLFSTICVAQKSKTDIYIGKAESEFKNDFLPQFRPSEGYKIESNESYNYELRSNTIEYTISRTDNPFPLNVLIAKGQVWNYTSFIKGLDNDGKNRFSEGIKKKTKVFKQIRSGLYEFIPTGEYQIYFFIKRNVNDSVGALFMMAFLKTSDPKRLEEVKKMILTFDRRANSSVEIID